MYNTTFFRFLNVLSYNLYIPTYIIYLTKTFEKRIFIYPINLNKTKYKIYYIEN